MAKSAEAFRSIGEVAKLVGVAPHVLRYWETQFTLLRPMKRGDGRRYYRPADIALAAGICVLLRDQGLTIRGARKRIMDDKGYSVRRLGAERLSHPVRTARLPAPTPWLTRLTDLNRKLGAMPLRDPRWPSAQPLAGRLAQALSQKS